MAEIQVVGSPIFQPFTPNGVASRVNDGDLGMRGERIAELSEGGLQHVHDRRRAGAVVEFAVFLL